MFSVLTLLASTSLMRTDGARAVLTVQVFDVALASGCHWPARFFATTSTVYCPLVRPLSWIGGMTAFAVVALVTPTSRLHAPPLTRYLYAVIHGPPTMSVTEVRQVGLTGTPSIDAPAGTSAPMSRPLYPVPTAGPGPGRSTICVFGFV